MNKMNNYHFKKLLNLQIKKYENNTIRYMNNIIKNNNNNNNNNNNDFKNFIKDQHKVLTKINIDQTNKIIDYHNNSKSYYTSMILFGGIIGSLAVYLS
jgi:hypothetical protein